jgi:hypothetical protein
VSGLQGFSTLLLKTTFENIRFDYAVDGFGREFEDLLAR